MASICADKPAYADTTPECGAQFGAPSANLTTLHMAACGSTTESYATGGEIVGWPGDGAQITLYFHSDTLPCSFTITAGNIQNCDSTGNVAYVWNVTSQSLQTIKVLYAAAGQPEVPVTVYALDIGAFRFASITPGSANPDGSVSGAGATLQFPGDLGTATLNGLQLTSEPIGGSATVAPPDAGSPFTSILRLSGALTLGADLSSVSASIDLPDLIPPNGTASTISSIDLGQIQLKPTGLTVATQLASPAAVKMAPFGVAVSQVSLTTSAQSASLALSASLDLPSYIPLKGTTATLPIEVSSGPVITIGCQGSSVSSHDGSIDLGGDDPWAVRIDLSNIAFHCTSATGAVDGVQLNAVVSLPHSTLAQSASLPIAISTAGIKLCPSDASSASLCRFTPVGRMQNLHVPIFSGPVPLSIPLAGLKASISKVELNYSPASGSRPERMDLNVSGAFNPGGITGFASQTLVLDLAPTVVIECPPAVATQKIAIKTSAGDPLLDGDLRLACDSTSTFVNGLEIESPTLSVGPNSFKLPTTFITRDGLRLSNNKPVDLSRLLPKPILLGGLSFSADTLEFDLPNPGAAADYTLKIKGTVGLPKWFDSASMVIPEQTIDLTTGSVIGGTQLQFLATDIHILGATLALGDTSYYKCKVGNFVDIKKFAMNICGELSLPNFLHGSKSKFLAKGPDAPPILTQSDQVPSFAIEFAFGCKRGQSISSCGLEGAPIFKPSAGLAFTDDKGNCDDAIDFQIFQLCVNKVSFLDSTGAEIQSGDGSTEPTSFQFDGSFLTGRELTSQDPPHSVTFVVNAHGMNALMKTGTIKVQLGQGQAIISNIELDLFDVRRSLHGSVAVIPSSSNIATIYFSDVGIDMTRQSSTSGWTFKVGAKPDLPRTAISFGQFLISALLAKMVFK